MSAGGNKGAQLRYLAIVIAAFFGLTNGNDLTPFSGHLRIRWLDCDYRYRRAGKRVAFKSVFFSILFECGRQKSKILAFRAIEARKLICRFGAWAYG